MKGKELCQEDKSIRPHSSPSYSVSNGHSNSQGFEIENYALLFKEQDEDLEGLRESVERLGNMGKSINEEISIQERLIGDVEHNIDTTTTRLHFVQVRHNFEIIILFNT